MLWGFVARLREAGIGLALVLLARHATGSFAVAGAASAAFYVAAAIMRPVQGRLMDRRGYREVLAVSAVANTLLLAAVAALAGRGPTWPLVVASAAAGSAMPATSSALRSLWPVVVSEERRDAAFALDSLLYELAIVIGPALVGLIATTAEPGWAVVTVAGVGLIGTLGIALAPVGSDRTQRPDAQAGAGAGFDARFRVLIAVAFLVGAAEGPLTLTLPAAALRDHASAVSGLLISALAVGSVLGLLLYGTRTWRSGPLARLVAYTAALTGGLLVLAAATASTSVVTLVLAAVAVGVALGPTITTIALAVNLTVPSNRLAESFAWTSFATPTGAAAAQAMTGVLVAGPGPAAGVLAAAGCAVVATIFAVIAQAHTAGKSACAAAAGP